MKEVEFLGAQNAQFEWPPRPNAIWCIMKLYAHHFFSTLHIFYVQIATSEGGGRSAYPYLGNNLLWCGTINCIITLFISYATCACSYALRANIYPTPATGLRKLVFHFFSNWMGYDCRESFPFNFKPNGNPFGSENRKENCLHDHIPLNLKGNVT